MGTVKSFIKETIARITGDDATVVAQKNYRKGKSAVEAQLATLKAKKVDAENDIIDAEDALSTAKYPTTVITNNESYLDSIRFSYQNLEDAKSALDNINVSISFYEDLLASFDAEVEA